MLELELATEWQMSLPWALRRNLNFNKNASKYPSVQVHMSTVFIQFHHSCIQSLWAFKSIKLGQQLCWSTLNVHQTTQVTSLHA